MSNPLLDTSALPRFGEIEPGHVMPAIEKTITEQKAALDRLLASDEPPSLDTLVAPVENMEHELGLIWSPVSHLQAVLGSMDWREAYTSALPLLTEHGTEMAQNERLQQAYATIRKSLPDEAGHEGRSAVDKALRDFHLAGVDLEPEAKERFKVIMQELAATQADFEHNVQDASDAWSLHIGDAARLDGLPPQVLARAADDAGNQGMDGWLLQLDFPTYDAVMTHALDRSLRETFYRAWVTRGSDQGKSAEWDNSDNMEKILALRHEAAGLVGFETYAHYSLATKMADTPAEVTAFLRELAARSRRTAERELAELSAFAGMELEAWDVTFWLEQFKQSRFAISNEELRLYFPADRVVEGLFDVASTLYQVRLTEKPGIAAWHRDVRYFVLSDAEGNELGGFYTDLHARNGKRTGAWIDVCADRRQLNGKLTLPVGYLVCNFPPPDERGVSLLTHNDVVTLFHEFGHMLHHLLTRVGFPSVSGINGVPWDAVELPSQFMENFAWNFDVLERCSAHVETGEPLPRAMFDKLEDSRHAGAALAMLRQLELGLYDLRLHAEYVPGQPARILETLAEVRDEIALIRHPDYNRFPHAFSHIFAGGYAAGYYSYKWAEVLAADAFAAFEEAGTFDAETARRFRREILEVGGSRDIMDAYVTFRGRKPTIDALLRQHGIRNG